MIVSKEGLVQCSTLNKLVGLDLSDREYLKQARETGGFVFSDFLFAKSSHRPIMMAAYPVSAINREQDSIVVAGINLDWMSKIMSNLGRRRYFRPCWSIAQAWSWRRRRTRPA